MTGKVKADRATREEYLRKLLFKNPGLSSRDAQAKIKKKFGQGLQRKYLLEIKREYSIKAQVGKALPVTIKKPSKPKAEPKPETLTKAQREIASRKKILLSEGFLPAEANYLSRKNWDSQNLQAYRADRHALYAKSKKRGDTRKDWAVQIGSLYGMEEKVTPKGKLQVKARYLSYRTVAQEEKRTKEALAPFSSFQHDLEIKLVNNGFEKEEAHYIASSGGIEKALQSAPFEKVFNQIVEERKARITDLKAKGKGRSTKDAIAYLAEKNREDDLTFYDFLRIVYDVTQNKATASINDLVQRYKKEVVPTLTAQRISQKITMRKM
jgi:hypothetical protein